MISLLWANKTEKNDNIIQDNYSNKNLELAKSINFKSIPDKIIETDEFGFFKKQTKILIILKIFLKFWKRKKKNFIF